MVADGADRDQTPGPAGDAETEEPRPLTERERLLAELGHTDDARGLIDAFLTARAYFERGDNQRATAELRALLAREPSPELAEATRALLERIRPDRVALIVLVACAIGLGLIWFFAVGAY